MRNRALLLVPVVSLALHGCVALDDSSPEPGDTTAAVETDGTAAEALTSPPTPCERACYGCHALGTANIRAQCDEQIDKDEWLPIAVCAGIAVLCDDAKLGAFGDVALCVASCQGGH